LLLVVCAYFLVSVKSDGRALSMNTIVDGCEKKVPRWPSALSNITSSDSKRPTAPCSYAFSTPNQLYAS